MSARTWVGQGEKKERTKAERMYSNQTILALIPARGGSKSIPGKNIKAFGGHPLIAYTIAAARRSRYVDSVVVTTDSEEIAAIARTYGAETPFLRPAELASDASRTIDAVVHAVEALSALGRSHDAVALLQPTSPLRRAEEIDAAIETFFSHGRLGLASVSDVVENPVLTRRLDRAGVLHPILPVPSTVRRQDMPRFWHVDGAIYLNRVDDLTPETSLNDNPIGFVMPRERSSDIDDIEDFLRAEHIMRELGDPLPDDCSGGGCPSVEG